MGSSVFPSLPGMAFPVNVTEVWDTTIQQAISGKETRIARQSYPRRRYEIPFSVLRSAAAFGEYQQLLGFFNALQGQFDSFLYTDPDDSSVTGQGIGNGNNSTAAFQLVRGLGGFSEPILAPNAVGAVYLNGVSIPSAGLSAPGAPTLSSSTAGALGATTYYVRVAWQTNSGNTLAGTEASIALAANRVLTVTRPASPPVGAINWLVYVSNTAGGGSGAETLQAALPVATTLWTEPTSGLVAGGAMPAFNTTGWIVNPWGTADSNGPGVLRFTNAPGSGVVITADFTYYWPCRMTDDSLSFTMFLKGMYDLKKFAFVTVKN